jgi:antitoxin HigA-1
MGSYKVIGKNGDEIKTDIVLHPGEVLAEELLARKITKSSFAMGLNIYPSHFSDILKGKRNITAQIALKLEKALGISAEFWLRLQSKYDLSIERKKLQLV